MRHILSVIIIAALLVATAVEVVAGWTKIWYLRLWKHLCSRQRLKASP